MSQRNRHLDPRAAADLLDAIRVCRFAATRALATAPIGSPGAAAIGDAIGTLDRLTEALTGDREHFWMRPHSVPKRAK